MNYHFIGIGGVGISALAQICLQKGAKVQGSDQKLNEYTKRLQEQGATIFSGEDSSRIQEGMTVVYSTAIPAANAEREAAQQKKVRLLHRSDFLADLMQENLSLLVTGAHGKTTTSSLLAWTLEKAGLDPTFVLGGKIKEWKTNARLGKGKYFVAEADESDGTFLKLPAYGAIVTNLEEDHLDFWKDFSCLKQAFAQFLSQVSPPHLLFWGYTPHLKALNPPGFSYGFQKQADVFIDKFVQKETTIQLDLTFQGITFTGIEVALLGKHNAENAAAVFALCYQLQIPPIQIKKAFACFPGVERRLDIQGEENSLLVIDDYAHHPTEIEKTLATLQSVYAPRRVVAIWQPHRFSRLLPFASEFFASLKQADLAFATDVFAAGEAEPTGWNPLLFFANQGVHYLPKGQEKQRLLSYLEPYDVVVLLNAGNLREIASILLEGVFPQVRPWRIALLFGGRSPEHEISLKSASFFIKHLEKMGFPLSYFGMTLQGDWIVGKEALEKLQQKKEGLPWQDSFWQELKSCDIAIPIFHGPCGEDGMIQGFLQTLKIPYVGSDYRSSAICMHKGWLKALARQLGIPTAKYVDIEIRAWKESSASVLEEIQTKLIFPLWVKAVHLGSSLGVYRVDQVEQLKETIEKAFFCDDALVVEEEIQGRIIEFSVMGNQKVEISPAGEVLAEGGFYSYEGKYIKPVPFLIPAPMPQDWEEKGKQLAKKIYEAASCRGMARVDFFLDTGGNYFFSEINPIPGFTPSSLYPILWEKGGILGIKLVEKLLLYAKEISRKKDFLFFS